MRHLTAKICLTLALFILSACGDYEKGADAYKEGDHATAISVFQPLAENKGFLSLFYAEEDVINAQSNLGEMYRKGIGVLQEHKVAVKWWKLAAEQGHARAQYNLGVMYGNGIGVKKDNVFALMWWSIAASSGYKEAVKYRDIVAKRMTPADISTAQQLARECVRRKYMDC